MITAPSQQTFTDSQTRMVKQLRVLMKRVLIVLEKAFLKRKPIFLDLIFKGVTRASLKRGFGLTCSYKFS